MDGMRAVNLVVALTGGTRRGKDHDRTADLPAPIT